MTMNRASSASGRSLLRGRGVPLPRVALALFLALAAVGCQGVPAQTVCYIGTSAVVHSVDTGMSVAGDLYRAGRISDAQKAKLVAAHDVYRPAAQAVVAGCKAVDTQGDAERQIALINEAADRVIEALVKAGVIP